MPEVKVKDGEHFEGAIRRFKNSVKKQASFPKSASASILKSQASKRKKKELAARKRLMKKMRKVNRGPG